MTVVSDLVKGQRVWYAVDGEEAYLPGVVVSLADNGVTLKRSDIDKSEETFVPQEKLYLVNPPTLDGIGDMTRLSHLHEPAILWNLKHRYLTDEIYTYTGPILIAINPCKNLDIYTDEHKAKYKGQQLGELPPHPYAIADAAYQAMLHDQTNQAILVSGESGAGKTETTKIVMKYLANVAGREAGHTEQQILQSNPILEAFGNAKTLRNHNSSRFGKFLEIQFGDDRKISGARITDYLLEKSRIVGQSSGERNYHIFYQLCEGIEESSMRKKLRLGEAMDFAYLNGSGCQTIEGVDDASELKQTLQAMDVVGIDGGVQQDVLKILSAILHLGNVAFEGTADSSCSVSAATPFRRGKKSPETPLTTAATLLGVDESMLSKELCSKNIQAGRETCTVMLTKEQAEESRDALAKTIYGHLFKWIVKLINKNTESSAKESTLFGVLDIYGFESFKINSFEQLCINYANESLQQHFNSQIFKLEQVEYEKENIDWSYVTFSDNKECTDLIEKPMGILALLEEECLFPRGTDISLAEKLYKNLEQKENFKRPRMGNDSFIVVHYAGEVQYSTTGFLDKNKDSLHSGLERLCVESNSAALSVLFCDALALRENATEGKGGASSQSFLSCQFKMQLSHLMSVLSSAHCYYIRCIKPNADLKPELFSSRMITSQLEHSGVLDTIRISKEGYPSRRPFAEFFNRFQCLHPPLLRSFGSAGHPSGTREDCEQLLSDLGEGSDRYQMGLTKVFCRAGLVAWLEERKRRLHEASAIRIQSHARALIGFLSYVRLRRAVVIAQCRTRGMLARRLRRTMIETIKATVIQARVRAVLGRKKFLCQKASAVRLQSGVRRFLAQRLLGQLKWDHSAAIVQSTFRMYKQRSVFVVLRQAAVRIQARMRVVLAKTELKKLRINARDAGALKKQLEELKAQLAEERERSLALANETESLKVQVKEAEERPSGASVAEVEELQARLEKEERKRSELEDALRNVANEKRSADERHKQDAADLSFLRAEVKRYQKREEEKENQPDGQMLQQQLDKELEITARLQDTNKLLKADIRNLKDKLQMEKAKAAHLMSKANSKQAQGDSATNSEITRLRSDRDDLAQQIASFNKTKEYLMKTVADQERSLQKVSEEKEAAVARCHTAMSMRDFFQKRVREMEGELERTKTNIAKKLVLALAE